MDQTIVIDTGAAAVQRTYALPEETGQLVHAVKMLSHITDPHDVMLETCMAAWQLFDTCRTAAITQACDDGYALVKMVRDGSELPCELLSARLGISPSKPETSEGAGFPTVPKDSITYRIADALKPTVWLQGEHNPPSFWFKQPALFGVPWFRDDHVFAGALVVTLTQRETPADHQVFALQLIADALSASYAFCRRYRKTVQMEQAIARERIARGLHDSVAQSIFSIQMKTRELLAQENSPEALREGLCALKAMADETSRGMRRILAPGSSQHPRAAADLSACLEEEIALHNAAQGAPVSLVCEDPGELPKEVPEALRAVLREGLCNVRKHAHASQALVTVARQGGFLCLSLIDDGMGLCAARKQAHGLRFGMGSLERLVTALDGHFGLEDLGEEGGAMLYARIPSAP